jgi:L-asparaginase/Glu-tRNA(Gln) amidotransferase subunit D
MVEHPVVMPEAIRPVSVLSAGGAIAMTPRQNGGGAVPGLDAAALVRAVPGPDVQEVRTVRALPAVHSRSTTP